MKREVWEEGVFSVDTYSFTKTPAPESGNWSVVMINTDAVFIERKPVVWSGMSEKAAQKKLREMVNYCSSAYFTKVSKYAHVARLRKWEGETPGHLILAMTDTPLTVPYRQLRPDQLPI